MKEGKHIQLDWNDALLFLGLWCSVGVKRPFHVQAKGVLDYMKPKNN